MGGDVMVSCTCTRICLGMQVRTVALRGGGKKEVVESVLGY